MLHVLIDGQKVTMELNSRAPTGIISKKTLQVIKPGFHNLQPTSRQFVSYTRHPVKCVRRIVVDVTLNHTMHKIYVYIVDEEYDSLFGLEWISELLHEINWIELFSHESVHNLTISIQQPSLEQNARLNQLIAKYDGIFSQTAGN